MKSLVFDTGPIISLSLNNMLWLLDPLKFFFKGDFIITPLIKKELIDSPIESKKFEFEALQVLSLTKTGTFKVIQDDGVSARRDILINLANRIFRAKGSYISIVHPGEMEALSAAISLNSNAIVIDERTTRYLLETPKRLHLRLEKKLHTTIELNKPALVDFSKMTRGINVIRSVELVTYGYERGLFNKLIPDIKNGDLKLLDAALWAVKLSGCAISEEEIEDIKALETKKNKNI